MLFNHDFWKWSQANILKLRIRHFVFCFVLWLPGSLVSMARSQTPLRSLGFKSVRGPGRTKSFEPNFSRYLKGRTSKTLWRCVGEHRTEKWKWKEMKCINDRRWCTWREQWRKMTCEIDSMHGLEIETKVNEVRLPKNHFRSI